MEQVKPVSMNRQAEVKLSVIFLSYVFMFVYMHVCAGMSVSNH